MKIGVISDTHGNLTAVEKAVEVVGKVDLWLHAGDYSQDSKWLENLTGIPIVAVKGNCDGTVNVKVDEFISFANYTIWLTHGHRYQVKQNLTELCYWARQYGANIVVYGHTHIPTIINDEDIIIFNPGSASLPPRDQKSTCGVIEIKDGNIAAYHVEIWGLSQK